MDQNEVIKVSEEAEPFDYIFCYDKSGSMAGSSILRVQRDLD